MLKNQAEPTDYVAWSMLRVIFTAKHERHLMRTKLVLGLTISAMAAVQMASAQGVSSPFTIDTAANQSAPSVEVVNTAADSTSVTVADFASSDVTVDNSTVFAPRVDASADTDASLLLNFAVGSDQPTFTAASSAVSSPSVVPAVDQYFAKRDSSSANGSADSSWMNVIPAAQGDMNAAAYTVVDASPSFDSTPSLGSKTQNPLIGEVAGASGGPGSVARMPMLITPEPGTVGLMIFGGTTLLGALRRRK